MKDYIPFWLGWVFFAVGCVMGLHYGWTLHGDMKPCPECPDMNTYEQAVLIMDECDRCRNKEAKNWEVAAAKRRDALAECLDLKDLYERQNLKWGSAVYKEMGETICGPYEWTCEQATEAAALAEKAYHNCLYDGHFPGYTLLDSWLDDQRAPDPVWDE